MHARYKLAVDRQGRVVLPMAVRRELGIEGGGQLTLDVEENDVRLSSRMLAIRRMQQEVRKHVPEGVSLVDELIADRRAEAARENGD